MVMDRVRVVELGSGVGLGLGFWVSQSRANNKTK